MCGIAGIFHFEHRSISRDVLQSMTEAIAHRGPDAEGIYIDGSVGLGHRRLSIIDLSTGQQPMQNRDGSLVITFNGEIYNYLELKNELMDLGYTFQTVSDTEVILCAYEEWGVSCQNRFNGMWAFAIWDRNKKELFVSRDRIGEKPLHYSVFDNSFIFGSEIKANLAYGVPRSARMELLEIYLMLGYIPAPHTFYRHIHKLRPGHYLLIKDGKVSEHEYWTFPQIDEKDMLVDESAVYAEFSHLLSDSVKIRMRSHVPFGAFLSGGLDSSSIVSLMSQNTDHPVETFTIGFKEKLFDERELASQVAAAFHTRHHEHLVEPDTFEQSLQRVLRHYDEPFGDSSAILAGHVSRHASQHVKMVLTGDGGDEVLSGYTIYQGEKFAAQYQRLPHIVQTGIPRFAEMMARPLHGNSRYRLNRVAKVCTAAGAPFTTRLISKLASINPEMIKQLLEGTAAFWLIEDYLDENMRDCQFSDPFYKLMYFHFRISLPDQMLTKVDRMSMAHSLEARVPFLDHRLVEFMAKVHKDVKMPGYTRKSILRNTVAKSLPSALLKAPKKGFVVPLREWFRGESFRAHLRDLLEGEFGIRKDIIERLVRANTDGTADNGNFIWILFLLKQWRQNVH
jgi:asparagine synthase (glutamine-hydrolysing)